MPSRTLITLSLMIATSLAARAQHVYSIRADSVRIYNVCDTAELILENHTQGVTGYLYNRGSGRTEFRKLELKNVGGTRIAIAGQDTLDLSQMSGIGGIDTIYRSGDSIRYVKKGVATSYFAPEVRPLGPVLAAGNQAFNNIILGDSTSTLQYYYQVNRFLDNNKRIKGYFFIGHTGNIVGSSLVTRLSDTAKLLTLSVNHNEPMYSPNGGANFYKVWHENNLTPVSIGAAPAAGSASYIQNQIINPQDAQFQISGRGLSRQAFEVAKYGGDTLVYTMTMRNPKGWGVNFQLSADTASSFTTWLPDGSAWRKRMAIAPNGTVTYDYMTVHGFSGERMSQRFNALGFNRNVWNGAIFDTSTYAFQFTHNATGSPATDHLTLQVYNRTGAEVNNTALAVNGLGNVGVFEKHPSDRLQVGNGEIYVKSNTNANNAVHKGIKFGTDVDGYFSAIRAWRGATSNRIGLSFFTADTSAPKEVMRLTENGRLGIGISQPSQSLDVNGHALVRGIVITGKITSANSDSSLTAYGGGANYGGQISLFGGLNGGHVSFHSGTGIGAQPERMRLDEQGRLGIGTTSPQFKLQVQGAAQINGFVHTNIVMPYAGDSSLHLIGGNINQGGQIGLFSGPKGGLIVFYAGTGTSQQPERMRITPSGAFGLGTNNPQFPVHVSTLNTAGMAIQNTGALSAESGAYLRLYNSGMPSASGQRLGATLYGANTTGATYEAGAQIDGVTEGAWTSNSQPTAIVFSTTAINTKGVSEKMRLSSAGNLTVSGSITATTITQTSRRELKTDIQTYSFSALEVLRNAQVRTFRFKADLTREHIGFIADEVPREMGMPDQSGVDQGNTVALLVKAVQELEQKNKALEDRLEAMEALLRELKDKR